MDCSLAKKGKKWYIVYREVQLDGSKRKIWKSTGEEKKSEAEKILIKFQNDILNNKVIKINHMSIKELLYLYLDLKIKNKSITTYEGYQTIVDKYMIPYFKEKEVQDISILDIDMYYNYLATECYNSKTCKKGLSANTIHRHHAILSPALMFAKQRRFINENYCDCAILPTRTKFKGSTALNNDEVKLLINKIEGTQIELLVHLAVGLGLRLSEICGLQWKHIDLKRGYITICQARVRKKKGDEIKDTKNDSSFRSLKIPTHLIYVLALEKERQIRRNVFQEENFVLCGENGKTLHPSTLSHQFTNSLIKNQLKIIRLHDLRHTNITLLLKNKVNLKVIQQRGGWSTSKILMEVYAHVLDEMEQEAVDTIDNAIYENISKVKEA